MSKIFVDGLFFRKPNENAPEFVKGKISVEVKKFLEFAKKHHVNGWVNIDLMKSKEGKLYLALNEYVKKTEAKKEETKPIVDLGDAARAIAEGEDLKVEEIPF